jgi:uncharacterized membrane protein YccC
MISRTMPSSWPTGWRSRIKPGLIFSVNLAVACVVSYWVVSELLAEVHSVSKSDDMLGGLWAVISTAFVYRVTCQDSHKAAMTRMSATLFSFALCLIYLLLTPIHLWGLALLIGVGAFVLTVIGRQGDIVICTITTAVVLIAAGLSPHNAWQQPILRLIDTAIGAAVGLGAAWAATHLAREPTL